MVQPDSRPQMERELHILSNLLVDLDFFFFFLLVCLWLAIFQVVFIFSFTDPKIGPLFWDVYVWKDFQNQLYTVLKLVLLRELLILYIEVGSYCRCPIISWRSPSFSFSVSCLSWTISIYRRVSSNFEEVWTFELPIGSLTPYYFPHLFSRDQCCPYQEWYCCYALKVFYFSPRRGCVY